MKKFLATLTIGLAIGAGLNAQGPGPTFSRDIAPIVYEHCVACHRPGEIGPFSLLTYSDVRQHATQIADVTRRRVMPPWKPAHGQVAFVGDRSLSDAQIQTVGAWVAQGAVEGNPSDLPPAPAAASGWQLGTPDLVVTMPAAYALQPAGTDVFRTFVIPIPTHEAKYVRAIEFRPGNSRAVHHANIGIDRTGSSRRLDAMDAEPGYVGGMVPDAAYPPGYMLGWTPGQRPRPSPDGMPWRLEASSDLVVQLHMQPTGKTEAVQISAGFYFTNDPPVQTPVGLRLGSETIDIPAGQTHYIVSDSYTLPVDVQVLAVQPHAHNLGRTMVATATLPDGSTRPLISIADWDFRWQDVYRYEHPMALPRGTVLYMEYSYDNSDGNARNTSHPPKHVVWGQNTTDEMGDLWVQMVPAAMADLAFLADDIGRKTRGEDLAAYTKLMNAEPGNPLRHDTVAMLSLQGGDAVAAAREFRASLRLNPDSAPTHYNLGIALSIERSYDEAMAEFREAIRVDPSYADAHNNLGALLTLTGQFDAAADHYRQALAIREDNADAHSNLARVLWAQGKGSEAVEHFRRASTLRPDAPSPMAGLAWIRATAPDVSMRNPVEAVTLGERAVALTGHRDPTVVDILAAAYASAGDFDRAAATAREALALASASGSKPLSDQIAARLSMYLQHVAFVSPQPATKP
ncbi:MAG TPA: tetratricopeptide repeat protein [Vicinamibacterales bacterium]|nr:tetratricopeptide repeat protein [Vicinamibacterales bacterium]